MGVMIYETNENNCVTVPCVTQVRSFSASSSHTEVTSGIDLQALYILKTTLTATIQIEQQSQTVSIPEDAEAVVPAKLFRDNLTLAFPTANSQMQLLVHLTRDGRRIIIDVAVGYSTQDVYSIVIPSQIVGQLTYSNGGGSDSIGRGLMQIMDDWETFPYSVSDDGYTIPVSNGVATLRSKYWLPLKIQCTVAGDTPFPLHFDLKTGKYIENGTKIGVLDLQNNTIHVYYSSGGGLMSLTSVKGLQWVAICGHETIYPDQLLIVTNKDENDETKTGRNMLPMTSSNGTNRLVVQSNNYKINNDQYIQRPYDAFIVSATNGQYGYDLSATSTVTSTPDVMSNDVFGPRPYEQEVVHDSGLMFITPHWNGVDSDQTQVVIANKNQVLMSNKRAYAIAAQQPTAEGFTGIITRDASNIIPMPLHYYHNANNFIKYDAGLGGFNWAMADYIGGELGMINRTLYVKNQSTSLCFCYVYNSEINIKSLVANGWNQRSPLTYICAYAVNAPGAIYFWVNNLFCACSNCGSTWYTAIHFSGQATFEGAWVSLDGNPLNFGFATGDKVKIQVNGEDRVLHDSTGHEVSKYATIILGEHYYTI